MLQRQYLTLNYLEEIWILRSHVFMCSKCIFASYKPQSCAVHTFFSLVHSRVFVKASIIPKYRVVIFWSNRFVILRKKEKWFIYTVAHEAYMYIASDRIGMMCGVSFVLSRIICWSQNGVCRYGVRCVLCFLVFVSPRTLQRKESISRSGLKFHLGWYHGRLSVQILHM
jgi:hypothetical protein